MKTPIDHPARNQIRLSLPMMLIAFALGGSAQLQAATTYHDGVSPALPAGTYDVGTFLPNHIAATIQDGFAAPITGLREYFYDTANANFVGTFNLVVYKFATPKDSVRLFPSQDHYFGGDVTAALAPEVMEYSVWGSNTGGSNPADWTMLSNPIGWTFPVVGKPEYQFSASGVSPTDIYRGGSSEAGASALQNAYVQDYTFANAYTYFGFRASSIAITANTADPELDTMVAFNRIDVTPNPTGTPDAGHTLAMLGLAIAGLVTFRRHAACTNP